MKKYPHVPAAFINALAEEGSREEILGYLQEQWNESCALREEVKRLETHPPAESNMGLSELTVALVALAEHGIPSDVQELAHRRQQATGNPRRRVAQSLASGGFNPTGQRRGCDMLTEDDACKKFCPVTFISGNVGNCIGSRCMVWRKSGQIGIDPNGRRVTRDLDGRTQWVDLGYCGLAALSSTERQP